jgi:hypothetical protein
MHATAISFPSATVSLSTGTATGATTVVRSLQTKGVEIVLKLAHHAMKMLPSVLVFHVGGGSDKMAQTAKVEGILAMKTMTPNTARIPTTAGFALTLSMLLTVAAFPTRLRIVVLKGKQSKPQGDNQSDEPKKRSQNAPTLVPHGHSGGNQNRDDIVEKNGREMEQQAKLNELEISAVRVPNFVQREGIAEFDMPS